MKIRNVIHRVDLAAEYVRSILNYDPDTGAFTWNDAATRGRGIGRIAGTFGSARRGYIRRIITIHYQTYRAQNIAWLIMTGDWPPKGQTIDHINKDPTDNRWSNLRLATPSHNQANRSKQINNTSGFKGVSYSPSRGKFQAGIGYRGKRIPLGRFDTAEEAYAAYCEAAKKYHGEFARTE